jgi:leucyl-tRNA synthetase family protein
MSFDWSRRLHTSDPEYYRWTQWLFLRFYERGLAYRKASYVNWCPHDQTVLANEQVIQGRCERCGHEVTKRELTQWYFKTTEYAQRLLDDMELLQWPEEILLMQRNWIGRSEGAFANFQVEGRDEPIKVFTTRPDTLFGATFMVVAPDAKLAAELVTPDQQAAFDEYLAAVKATTEIERLSTERDKTGVFLGSYAINPVTGQRIPIWAADYVLADYGTGAIMAVPGQDTRDWEFAEKFELPIVRTVEPRRTSTARRTRVKARRSTAPTTRSAWTGWTSPTPSRGSSTGWRQGAGRADDQLPAARLAAEPAAVLGLPDPDHPLPVLRRGAGPGRPAADGAARPAWRRPAAEGCLAAGGRPRVGRGRLPEVRWQG